jgi:hypothetical protein
MQFENLKVHDPFAEADNVGSDVTGKGSFVHIRIQQRSGRKTLTTVQVRSPQPTRPAARRSFFLLAHAAVFSTRGNGGVWRWNRRGRAERVEWRGVGRVARWL